MEDHKRKLPMLLMLLFILNEYARPMVFAQFKVVFIVQILFMYLIVSNGKFLRQNYNIFFLWFVLMLEMFIHIFFAANTYWAFNVFKSTFSYFLFFVMVSCFVDTREKMISLFLCFILVNTYCALVGIVNKGLVPGNGFLRDENDFALAMNIALPFTIYISFLFDGLKRYLLWVFSLIMFWAVVASVSRGGMVGLAVVLFLIWLKSRYKVISLIVLLFGLVIFTYNMPEEFKSEMYSIAEQGATRGTGRERIEFWKVSTRIFLAYPIMGIGQGNIPYRLNEFQGNKYWKRQIGGRVVHSLYFTLLPELGLVGVVIFCFFINKILLFYRDISMTDDRDNKLIVDGIMIGFAAYFVTGAFLSVLYYPHFWVLLVCLNSLWVNKDDFQSDRYDKNPAVSEAT